MALILDKDIYEHSIAHGYKFNGTEFLWAAGAIGALSPEQRKVKIAQKKVVWQNPVPECLKERIKKFQEGADAAEEEYNKEGRPGIERWLQLVKEEVENKRGIKLGGQKHLEE